MPISLNGSHRVCDRTNIDEGESCTDYSLLGVYTNHEQYQSSPDVMNMNFVQIANNGLARLPENTTIFPTYSPNPGMIKNQLTRF